MPNPNPNPPPVFEKPNLIPRIIRRQEISVSPRPLFRSYSCPTEWLFLEDLPFEKYFETSLFRTTSNSELLDLVPDPEFTRELEIQRANLSIDQNLLNSTQSSLNTDRTRELLETSSLSFSSSLFPHLSEVNPPLHSFLHFLFSQSLLNTLPLPLILPQQPKQPMLPQLRFPLPPNLESWPIYILPL